jgi:predicted GNAT family N-acyltransferase
VAAEARRRGVGAALLRAAEDEARAAGGRRIVLAAQTAARGLYTAAGYAVHGEPFDDAGIEHVLMEKALA